MHQLSESNTRVIEMLLVLALMVLFSLLDAAWSIQKSAVWTRNIIYESMRVNHKVIVEKLQWLGKTYVCLFEPWEEIDRSWLFLVVYKFYFEGSVKYFETLSKLDRGNKVPMCLISRMYYCLCYGKS